MPIEKDASRKNHRLRIVYSEPSKTELEAKDQAPNYRRMTELI